MLEYADGLITNNSMNVLGNTRIHGNRANNGDNDF